MSECQRQKNVAKRRTETKNLELRIILLRGPRTSPLNSDWWKAGHVQLPRDLLSATLQFLSAYHLHPVWQVRKHQIRKHAFDWWKVVNVHASRDLLSASSYYLLAYLLYCTRRSLEGMLLHEVIHVVGGEQVRCPLISIFLQDFIFIF